jgi:hypothetical protein
MEAIWDRKLKNVMPAFSLAVSLFRFAIM